MLVIDGSAGEGGGQILRTALSLSLVTQTPFRITNIRSARKRPGLQKQHLAAVRAAQEVGHADVKGAELNSLELTFAPETIEPGKHNIDVGSAGSATLVLQTILPALMIAPDRSYLVLEGGTHNPMAPPFDFMAKAFLPILKRMGVVVKAHLVKYGFYPAGGGQIEVEIKPYPELDSISLMGRGEIIRIRARAIVSNLPSHIIDRELRVIKKSLNLDDRNLKAEEIRDGAGPGNVVMIEVESKNITELFTGFGEKKVRAEDVARQVVTETRNYIDANVPVGEYLADQLLIPMALAGGGSFITTEPSLHTLTNIEIIKKFIDVDFKVESSESNSYTISVSRI